MFLFALETRYTRVVSTVNTPMQYRTSSPFRDAERAALDYVTELTTNKKVKPETFARLAQHFSEREICDIVWLVASKHVYNMTNLGLNIHSDMLCDISRKGKQHEIARTS